MSLARRLTIAAILLSITLGAQLAVDWHTQAAGKIPQLPLNKPLDEFPETVDEWRGQDVPITNPEYLYGDEHLNRYYVQRGSKLSASVWMGYSSKAKDRQHNPEVCMPAHGRHEVDGTRGELAAPGHDQPIRRYLFSLPDGTGRQWVYYWHYTLIPTETLNDLTKLQLLRLGRQSPASVTLEVFAPAGPNDDTSEFDKLVLAVDREFQQHLPPGAHRSSTVRPVYLINDGGFTE